MENQRKPKPMTHFYHSKNLFLDKTEESMVLNGRETEYIRFDYDYDEEILPHLINTFTNRRVRATRKLENIRLFNRKSIIGMVLRDFEFMDTQSLNELSGITMNSDISLLIFINCRFGGTVIDIPASGVGFYNCVFEERIVFSVRVEDGLHVAEFDNCTFNAMCQLGSFTQNHSLSFTNCLFNENGTFKATDYRCLNQEIFDSMEIRNCIFKGDVDFEKAKIPDGSVFQYLTFYREVNFKDTQMGKNILWQNLCFAPFVNKVSKDGFKSFVKALADNNYKKEAKYFEANYGESAIKKVNKDEYDIAVDSGWLNIQQAALFLGVKYSSLLDMRKDDKILGAQRIPYIGEGKNSRYYVPLLKAYKNKDMKKVKELELEMRQMEQNI